MLLENGASCSIDNILDFMEVDLYCNMYSKELKSEEAISSDPMSFPRDKRSPGDPYLSHLFTPVFTVYQG